MTTTDWWLRPTSSWWQVGCHALAGLWCRVAYMGLSQPSVGLGLTPPTLVAQQRSSLPICSLRSGFPLLQRDLPL